jgi:hypothetical protein
VWSRVGAFMAARPGPRHPGLASSVDDYWHHPFGIQCYTIFKRQTRRVCSVPFRLLITNRSTRPVPLRIVLLLLIPQQERPLSQVSQLSQLPRQRLIRQTIRIPIHKQHLSQVSQLSQCTLFGEELLAYAFCHHLSATLEALFQYRLPDDPVCYLRARVDQRGVYQHGYQRVGYSYC